MTDQEIPDYTEDWKKYWGFRRSQRLHRQLKKVAEKPTRGFLPVKPSQLNPASDDYNWFIDIEDLRENPDSVLEDARAGFAEFVSDSEITDEPQNCYDILPVNFTEGSFNLSEHFFGYSRFERTDPNTISQISVELAGNNERFSAPAAVNFECTAGHQTRVIQPIYDRREIETCSYEDCTNSVYSVSQKTSFLPVVSFDAVKDNSEIECVAAGKYAEDTAFQGLTEADGPLNLFGIVRYVIPADSEAKRVFEVLSIDYS